MCFSRWIMIQLKPLLLLFYNVFAYYFCLERDTAGLIASALDANGIELELHKKICLKWNSD